MHTEQISYKGQFVKAVITNIVFYHIILQLFAPIALLSWLIKLVLQKLSRIDFPSAKRSGSWLDFMMFLWICFVHCGDLPPLSSVTYFKQLNCAIDMNLMFILMGGAGMGRAEDTKEMESHANQISDIGCWQGDLSV